MSGLDIVIAIVVLIGLWRGFQLGLIKTAIGLVGWFIALIAATSLAGVVSPQLADIVQSPVLANGDGLFIGSDCDTGNHASDGFRDIRHT